MWENVKESISIVTQIYSLMQLIVASACTVIILASANEKTKALWKRILKDVGLGRDSSCDNDCAGRDVFVAFTVLAKFFARE